MRLKLTRLSVTANKSNIRQFQYSAIPVCALPSLPALVPMAPLQCPVRDPGLSRRPELSLPGIVIARNCHCQVMPWLKDVHFNPVGAGRDVIGISGLPACPDNVDGDAIGNVHRHPIIDRQARGDAEALHHRRPALWR